MKRINFENFMNRKPTLLKTCCNTMNQNVKIFENPIYGDESPVVAVIDKTAIETDFFDTADLYTGSDYLPVLTNEGIMLNWELGELTLTFERI